jgi:hypothetical protein
MSNPTKEEALEAIKTIKENLDDLQDKVYVYETLLHRIQLHREVTMDAKRVMELLDLICAWSRAHRAGNGELSEDEQQDLIKKAYERFL